MDEFTRVARHALVWFYVVTEKFLLDQTDENWEEHQEAWKALLHLEGPTTIEEVDKDLADKVIQKGQQYATKFPGGERYLNPGMTVEELKQLAVDAIIWLHESSKKFLATPTSENWDNYQEALAALRIIDKLALVEGTEVESTLAARIRERANALRA